MRIYFEWDPRKAEINRSKHGVSFDEAMDVFRDPLAMSIFDEENSDQEDRWVTLGETTGAKLLLVVHTHVEMMGEDAVLIRIISARRATRREENQYRHGGSI
ncbi:MAG TPA: BrnT family toxin [Rhizomicrobium sp.]|nr:BrnT family toxin [Rhizomicrobium sp.]